MTSVDVSFGREENKKKKSYEKKLFFYKKVFLLQVRWFLLLDSCHLTSCKCQNFFLPHRFITRVNRKVLLGFLKLTFITCSKTVRS